MTSDRVAVLGTGLVGTSIAMAAGRVGCDVRGWDADPATAGRSAAHAGLRATGTLEECVADAEVVVVSTPIPSIGPLAARALVAAAGAVVTDVASIKSRVLEQVEAAADPAALPRFVGGHPMGGSERSGPEHASASIVDGIVWVISPSAASDPRAVERIEGWIRRLGALPVRIEAARHDRLVAVVSHLPQVASTSLMSLAAAEEANEPEMLLLAAGGFRDLTRLAASNPALWSEILLANREAIADAIDLYVDRLRSLRDMVAGERAEEVRDAFAAAKAARLTLAAKPQVRAGVVVLQIGVPDRPGALAQLTGALADASVNIEDLQIVHSPEGGRGAVYLTVSTTAEAEALRVLGDLGLDPTRLA
ncbi:MAG TPA: prephenate dehydrogenase/arogenate dehydrogenase family protein [Actinomycetota bacterium]|jgi:prephenate dehydrogenase|nr:prephenate dehydrogenase/arogenate dehydrogenase family protein [Actinomycetota bacterium]